MMPHGSDDMRYLLLTAGSSGAIGALVGAARYVVIVEQGGFRPWLRSIVASTLIGVLVGLSIDGMSWTGALKWAVVIVAALLSESAVRILIVLGKHAETNPIQFFKDVMASLRGGYQLPAAPLPPAPLPVPPPLPAPVSLPAEKP